MNKTKKTLLLASVIALGTKAAIDFSTIKVNAAQNNETNAISSENTLEYDSNTVKNQKEESKKTVESSHVKMENAQVSQSESTGVDEIVAKINNGTEDYTDYKTLKISGVKSDNHEVIKNAIKNAKASKGSNLTKEEINSTVSSTLTKVNSSINKINAGTAIVDDYKNLLITTVNDENIQDVNSFLKGKRYKLISKISALASNVINALNDINVGNITEANLNSLEIPYQNSSNIPIIKNSIVKERASLNKNLNKTEIESIVNDTLSKIDNVLNNLNLGNASLEDYLFIGAVTVNSNNISDVNAWVKGKRWSDINNVLNEISSIVDPLNHINSGNDSTLDYETLEIENVTDSNIENVRIVIRDKKASKGSDLNRNEIAEAANEALVLSDLYEYIKGGYATAEDYEFAGLENVTDDNVKDINDVLINTDYKTIKEMQNKINSVIESISKINEGTDTVEDYANIFINEINEENIAIQKISIQKVRAEKGKDLNRDEIIESINNTLKFLESFKKINNGEASLEDYKLLGIIGVTEENLSFINDNVKGNNIKTVDELQAKVNEALEEYAIYKKIDDGTVTKEELIKIHIEIDDEYFEYFKKELIGKHIYNYDELRVEVKVVKRIVVSHKHIISGNAAIEDFIIYHHRTVTEKILRYINEEIRVLRRTHEAISDEYIDEYFESITTYISIFERSTSGNLTPEDFKALGLGDIVNESNINYIILHLKGRVIYSKTEFISIVQRIIKEQEIFTRINLGTAAIIDYEYLHIYGVTVDNITSINDYVKDGGIINIVDLQAKVDIVIEQLENITHTDVIIRRINLGKATIADFEYLGITNITIENIDYVNSFLVNGSFTTVDEIKAKIALIINEYNYYLKINAGEATIDVYTHLGITGVTLSNINFINVNIKGYNYLTVAEIQAKVDAILSIYDYYVIINQGQATLDIYTSLGITGVTLSNIDFINLFIKNEPHFDLVSLQESINVLVHRYDAFVKITSGTAAIEDYEYLGITIVTSDNIAFVNSNINLTDCFDIDVIKARVNVLVIMYTSYININAGTATVDDYVNLGITGVTVDNLIYINAELKGADLHEVNSIQLKVNEVIDIFEELVRITAGRATVEDYVKVNITGVTALNIGYINVDIKAKGLLKLEDIKARVETVFSIYSVLGRINIGTATIDDYVTAGALNVTVDNLDYINLNIKGNSFDNYAAVQAKVNEIVTQYEISIKIKAIIERINLGTATIEDYEYINIHSVTPDNIEFINADFVGKNYTDVTAISERVNVLIKIYDAINNINLGIATIEDYNILQITGINADLIPYVNADLKDKNYRNISDIQLRINENINLYVVLNKINLGTATLEDYISINITSVTEANLIYVNADLKGQNLYTKEQVVERINVNISIYEILERINAGTASIDDFRILNITSITSDILVYANADLKGRNFTLANEVENIINERLVIYEALLMVNLGTASLSDYSILGAGRLSEDLIIYVNADLKGRNYITADMVKVRIEQNLNIYEILKIINAGTASIDNYVEIGTDKVTDYLRVYVNVRIKGLNLLTVEEVINKVNDLVDNVVISKVQGTIVNSSNARPISGVLIKIKTKDGAYLTKNGVVVSATADSNGKYTIELPDGEYTIEASKDNYITENFDVIADKNKENEAQNGVMVPIRSDEKYSVVLTWGSTPNDLDSHLKGNTGDGKSYHIYYSSKSYSSNGEVIASLDVDDTSSYGPETTTFTADVDGTYAYSIQDFSNRGSSNSKALSNSGATIKVYKGNELVKTYTVPTNSIGTVWDVFRVENGEIIDVNTLRTGTI